MAFTEIGAIGTPPKRPARARESTVRDRRADIGDQAREAPRAQICGGRHADAATHAQGDGILLSRRERQADPRSLAR